MSGKSQGNWSWLESGHSEYCQSMNNAHHWCCVKQWNFVFITSPLLNCLMGDSSRKTNRMFFTSQLSSVYRALHHVMSLCRLTLCLYLVFSCLNILFSLFSCLNATVTSCHGGVFPYYSQFWLFSLDLSRHCYDVNGMMLTTLQKMESAFHVSTRRTLLRCRPANYGMKRGLVEIITNPSK